MLAGLVSEQDAALRGRVSLQLEVARLSLHEVFFELPVRERMAFIAHSRLVRAERRARDGEVRVHGRREGGRQS